MKKLILISIFLLQGVNAFEESAVDFNFRPEARFFDQLTKDLREDMPDEITSSDVQLDDEGNLHIKLVNGYIDLKSIREKMFTLTPLSENRLKVNWNFKALRGQFKVRADWTVDVLGVTIRKHEVFDIFASQINTAESIFQIIFEEGTFKLKLLKNSGFTFNNIEVRSTDDDVLTWILEKIDETVRDYLNEEIRDYFSGPKFSQKFQEMIEDDLNELENIRIHVSDYATKLQARFNHFRIDDKGIEFKLDTQFLGPTAKVHACARELMNSIEDRGNKKSLLKEGQGEDISNINPGTLKVSYSFVESIVENLSIYEADEDNDGIPDEPLFCFGYKDADHSGKVEEVAVKILGKEKKINLKFWAYPISKPKYQYQMLKEGAEGSPQHLVTATMKAKVKFGDVKGYPKLIFKDDVIVAKVTMDFRLKVIPGKGLHMVPIDFKLDDFDGKVYYKSKKWLPKIPLPFFALKNKIESELLSEIQSSLSEKTIIDEVIPAMSLKVKLRNYRLESDAHQMDFNVLYE